MSFPDSQTGQALTSAPSLSLTQGSSAWLTEHLQRVQDKIVEEAARLAAQDNRAQIDPRDIAEAAKAFAPGIEVSQVPQLSGRPAAPRKPLLLELLSSAPSITTVSAVLAVIFGVIGWRAKDSSAFDIAKVFAGAIVGAAGATVKNKF